MLDSTTPAESNPDSYLSGRLPMSEEELRLLERNRRMMRRVAVPLMGLLGAAGLMGGVWTLATDTLVIGIGLTSSAVIMLGFAWYYIVDTRKPIERPEKYFVRGIITRLHKSGSGFTNVYYSLELNDNRYKCFIQEAEFKRLKVGDVVMCERLEENSVYADRVIKVR